MVKNEQAKKVKCPYCSSTDSKVLDKRSTNNFEATRRRRECLNCAKRFTTYERIETAVMTVIKKDKTRQEYSREKILKGIMRACEKRPISREQMEAVTDEIEAELRGGESSEFGSKVIGELISKKLKKLDKIAYIRFASVYKEFADLSEFEKEVSKLQKK